MTTRVTDHEPVTARGVDWDLSELDDFGWNEPAERGRHQIAIVHFLTDLVTLAGVLIVVLLGSNIAHGDPIGSRLGNWRLYAAAMSLVVTLWLFRLYEPKRRIAAAPENEWTKIVTALSVHGFLFQMFLHQRGIDAKFRDSEILAFFMVSIVAIPAMRRFARRVVVPRIAGRQRTIIIGAGRVGQELAHTLRANNPFGLEILGFVDSDPPPRVDEVSELPLLGGEDELDAIVKRTGAERVIFTFSRAKPLRVIEMMRWSDLHRIHVSIVPRYFELMSTGVDLDSINGITLMELHPAHLSESALRKKRVFEVGLVAAMMPIMLPIFAAVALAIRLDSAGPILFRQRRAGRDGRVFDILKFRTMVVGAEAKRDELEDQNEVDGPLFQMKDDPRITRVGRFLRRTSLDELPQLFNVLRGEMSLVGPRPFVVAEDAAITGWARRRLDLTPGITGLWQVSGRNDLSFDEMIKLDYLYVTRWSLWWDIRILLKTIPAVLNRHGAY